MLDFYFFHTLKTVIGELSMLCIVDRKESHIHCGLKTKIFNICQQTTCSQGKYLPAGEIIFYL